MEHGLTDGTDACEVRGAPSICEKGESLPKLLIRAIRQSVIYP